MSNSQASNTLQGMEDYFFRASATDFEKVPGSPIAYWVSENVREIFSGRPTYGEVAEIKQGLATADDDRFLRHWYEVPNENIHFPGEKSKDRKSVV